MPTFVIWTGIVVKVSGSLKLLLASCLSVDQVTLASTGLVKAPAGPLLAALISRKVSALVRAAVGTAFVMRPANVVCRLLPEAESKIQSSSWFVGWSEDG